MTGPVAALPQSAVAQRFELFAQECRLSPSPLYERLSRRIADDPEILALAAQARRRPVPNLFFGAVHFLLLKKPQHPLSRFYCSLSDAPGPPEDAYSCFRSFCIENQTAIEALLSTRGVQTNEVGRCACLLPAFGLVAGQAGGRPLALVEIGASAGLNLLWDRYSYQYGEALRFGDPGSPVQILCRLQGDRWPPIPDPLPEIAYRVGLDLEPIDLWDPEATLWLRALIWPEHGQRADRLQRAIRAARQDPPPVVAGDAIDLLPDILTAVPEEGILCLYHTYTLNQFSQEARERLRSLIADHATKRALYEISIEGHGEDHALLDLISYRSGVRTEQRLACCCAHGGWIEWLEDGSTTDE